MSVFSSIVLTNPMVVGALAAGAVCWGGFIARPEPARLRTRLLAASASPHAHALSDVGGRVSRLRRSGLRRSHDRVTAELPAIVEVMGVALASGLSITASLQLALAHCDAANVTARRMATTQDRPLDEALDDFGRACGPRARAFAGAVSGSLRTGIPLAPELDRLGRDLREDLRRRLEGRVRRLPVLLLFPLVLCVLPALGLVAIVPVLVAAFGA
ncbi:type II secretion system F family protein [Candidatus Poriferisodalis sp.]|uniref:type II secretion system F family protein n=1 Tax=Candidatus Poriferisodalis sp. TaxID=3101277 RepID=UPI003B02335D